ncbi:hypothetical protein KHC23_12955 [Ancylobacter dichloromethanicus]|uniref:Uncharacterized protein n=1 Tax=Ancylobacter dichloromethanicus TaxID=518825 RepID=A0A9W6J7B3_9HYPH|nr:hypothetical protein [Ancylobacter dichloromethanicus]MBS7554562.1 hypothetical protein [Ancylobacter dichloromethanicus]GLK71692.1 hypothetical protein GCM10017643_18070 [Ancylobacter dichloromethanicus]
MLARTPLIVIHRRPWRRVVPVARRMHALGRPGWEIAQRLRISRGYVARALSSGGGIWSPEEWARLSAALAQGVER